MPDPEKYLAMFVGLPFTYRRSVLADVSNLPDHSLESIVCRDPNLEVCKMKSGHMKLWLISKVNLFSANKFQLQLSLKFKWFVVLEFQLKMNVERKMFCTGDDYFVDFFHCCSIDRSHFNKFDIH